MTKLLTLPAQRRAEVLRARDRASSWSSRCFPASGEFEDAQENEATSFLPGDAESVKALKAIERFPDGEVSPAVTVIAREGGLTPEDQAKAQELVESLNERPAADHHAARPGRSRPRTARPCSSSRRSRTPAAPARTSWTR